MLAVVFPQRCHVFPQRFSLRILGISSCVLRRRSTRIASLVLNLTVLSYFHVIVLSS